MRAAPETRAGRPARPALRPARDAALCTTALGVAIVAGSRGLADLDPALLGYLGATLAACFATAWRVSASWRRPASAFYARALAASLRTPRALVRTLRSAGDDLAAQRFVARRSATRWLAHLLLSLGTIASFAITLPLVFGWMRFLAEDERFYRIVLFGVPTLRFDVTGAPGWLVFHALSLAGVAVLAGALAFLALRWRARRLPGATSGFAVAPLVLLAVVAATGLALPASRGMPALFPIAARLHEAAVVVLLVAIPFSKLGHVLLRPLQLGVRAVQREDAPRHACATCGAPTAPIAQQQEVERLLASRGLPAGLHAALCPPCRRRRTAAAQARAVNGDFQPPLVAARADAREIA